MWGVHMESFSPPSCTPAQRRVGFYLTCPMSLQRPGRASRRKVFRSAASYKAETFFEAVPEGADLHLLKQIIHDWDDERTTRLLKNCHRALAPQGTLLLVEMVVPPNNEPSSAQAMDLNMLVMLGGRERTEEEYKHLLAEVGFRLVRVIPTHSPFSVIEATRT